MAADYVFSPGVVLDEASLQPDPDTSGVFTATVGGAEQPIYDLNGNPISALTANAQGYVASFKADIPSGYVNFGSLSQPVASIIANADVASAITAATNAAASAAAAASSATAAAGSAADAASSAGSAGASGKIFSGDNTGATSVHTTLVNDATAAAAAGIPLIVKPGDYLMTTAPTNLPAGLRMIAPWGARFFRATLGVTMWIPDGAQIEGVTFETTYSAGSGQVCAQLQQNAKRVAFRHCKFVGQAGAQLVYAANTGIANVLFDDCDFNTGSYGFLSNSTDQTSGAWDLRDVKFINCRFDGFTGDPIEFNHPSTLAPACGDFWVENCRMTNPQGSSTSAGFGVGAAGVYDLTIKDNHIAARREAVHIEDDCRRLSITGNLIRSVAGTAANGGIWVYPPSQVCDISDNLLEGVTGTAIRCVYTGGASGMSDIRISGNIIISPTGAGIYAGADANLSNGRFFITENLIRGPGSNGITILGPVEDVVVDDNVIMDAAAWGVGTEANGGSTGHMRSYFGNKIINCTSGDYQGQPMSGGLSTVVPARHFRAVSAASTSTTLTVPLFRLGRYADGFLRIQGRHSGTPANRAEAEFRIRWDGTTLVGPRQTHSSNGTFTLASVSMVNGVLNVNITVTASGVQAELYAAFFGISFESATVYSGTVTSDTLAVTGSRAANAALASLLSKLALAGIITDSTTA